MALNSLTFLAMMNWTYIRAQLPSHKLEEFDLFKERLQEVIDNGYTAFHGDLDEDSFMSEATTYIFSTWRA